MGEKWLYPLLVVLPVVIFPAGKGENHSLTIMIVYDLYSDN